MAQNKQVTKTIKKHRHKEERTCIYCKGYTQCKEEILGLIDECDRVCPTCKEELKSKIKGE